jgi:hypothetical protein
MWSENLQVRSIPQIKSNFFPAVINFSAKGSSSTAGCMLSGEGILILSSSG